MRCLIAPSILACDLTRLGESIRIVEAAGADLHHVDVMDGHFVPNLTFGPDIVMAVRRAAKRPVDVHLMIEDPTRYAPRFIEAGADIVTFHVEVVKDPRPLLRDIRSAGRRNGLVIKPRTPASAVFPFLGELDMILVMTVEPGFTGQEFMPDCLDKITELRRRGGPDLDIEVDGGINDETVACAARAGANVVVAGAAVYRAEDPIAALANIRKVLEENLRERNAER